MILNVSGRTDIVAFYSKWFINRIKEGYIDVRNPFYPKNISRIYLSDIDLIVFCTKNPIPIIKYLPQINKPIIFHVTLTSYKNDIEPNVVNKKQIIEGIKEISKIIGIDNLYIRYDPIIINDYYSIEYHIRAFSKLTSLLEGYVKNIIISFVDDYKNVKKHSKELKIRKLDDNDYKKIGISFSNIAKEHNMTVQTCFENKNLVEYGFKKEDCLSKQLAYKMTGKKYKKWKARGCNCVEMVDIGVYNSCNHLCKYCYANYDEKQIKNNFLNHDPTSSLLIGNLNKEDIIKIRK